LNATVPSSEANTENIDGKAAVIHMDSETVNTQKKRSHSISEDTEPTQKEGKNKTDEKQAHTDMTGANHATHNTTSTIVLDYSDNASTPGKFNHLSKDEVKDMMKARGETMIEESGKIETQKQKQKFIIYSYRY
jgi:hypothetical protein